MKLTWSLGLAVLGASLSAPFAPRARGEDLHEAWAIGLNVDGRLRAAQDTTRAAALDTSSAKSARLPQLSTTNLPAFLTTPLGLPISGAAAARSGFSPTGQSSFMVSLTTATVPIYTGGRIKNTIEANRFQTNAAHAEEQATTLDVKLDIARAYVSVLRSGRGVQVAVSNVQSLKSQVRDVANLVDQGRAIRNDLLAAQVSLSNAEQREIQQKTALDIAWATYNRLLGRPLEVVVRLTDLAVGPAPGEVKDLAEKAIRTAIPEAGALSEDEVRSMIDRALAGRPELAQLGEQAMAMRSQADVQRASVRPQASFVAANIYQNTQIIRAPDFGAAAFTVSWNFFDGGQARKKAQAMDARALGLMNQRADRASRIALEVRTAWLTIYETRKRIPVTRAAIAQAEENLRVARSRYLVQRGTNTEVLDAETLRITSYDNYYNAVYDAVLAEFNLHRAIGDL